MSKSPATTPTQIVIAGRPSDALLSKLRQAGERLDDQQIAHAFRHAEKCRVDFVVASIAVGCLLLAKRESIPHGQWSPWCEKFGARLARETSVKLATPLPISEMVTPRSLRGYTFLAQHFLADLEQGDFTGEIPDHKPQLSIATEDVLALDTLKDEHRRVVFDRIEQFIAGRSLRRMLMDFRRAETAADQEEAEDAAAKRRRKDKGDQPGQLDFWAEIQRPLSEIETLCESRETLKHANKAFWENLATALEQQAERARKRAKEMAS